MFTVAEGLVKGGKREEYVINGMNLVSPEKADEWVRFVDSALTGSEYSDRYYVMKGDLKSEVILGKRFRRFSYDRPRLFFLGG